MEKSWILRQTASFCKLKKVIVCNNCYIVIHQSNFCRCIKNLVMKWSCIGYVKVIEKSWNSMKRCTIAASVATVYIISLLLAIILMEVYFYCITLHRISFSCFLQVQIEHDITAEVKVLDFAGQPLSVSFFPLMDLKPSFESDIIEVRWLDHKTVTESLYFWL